MLSKINGWLYRSNDRCHHTPTQTGNLIIEQLLSEE